MEPTQLPRRRRKRGRNVGAARTERIARIAITCGGIGTIAAVSGIFLFLVWIVFPIFADPSLGDRRAYPAGGRNASVARLALDEGLQTSWTLDAEGEVEVLDLSTGARMEQRRLFDGEPPTASAFQILSDAALFGFADGTLRGGRLGFDTEIVPEEAVPAHLRALREGAVEKHDGAIFERTVAGQLRATRFVAELDEPVVVGDGAPIALVDFTITPTGEAVVTWQEDPASGAARMLVSRVRVIENQMTGERKRRLTSIDVTPVLGAVAETPEFVALSGSALQAFVAFEDGRLVQFDLRDPSAPRRLPDVDLVPDAGARLTAFEPLAGKSAFIVGDSAGRLSKWFPVRDESTAAGDTPLERILEFPRPDGESSAVEHVTVSARSRVFVASFADRRFAVYHATTGDLAFASEVDEAITGLAIALKQDALLLRTAGGALLWHVELEHLDATLESLFTPVWYEDYAEPRHVWQSTSGSNDFEPKYGMVPLVFGTLKATFYSMLFGAPLALLAALFTSEFLSPRLRAPVKSTVELMASLPSVVLGFLAALVIAPFVQSVLPAVLAAFLAVPLAVLLGAYSWQLLPQALAIRWQGLQRFASIALAIFVGIGAGVLLGRPLEAVLFAGDVEAWLDGQRGSAFGGWTFILMPLGGLAAALLVGRVLGTRIRARSRGGSASEVARLELVRFGAWFLAMLALTALAALLLSSVGFDPRGTVVDTYVQRNAMIVGFAMGFAIIPIIYTLAEDALSEVPGHLREGSLGAGATPWQTATRIVIPFAMSGMFSALMIGLGRAVGETMIVLMAAGNTPIMEWNVFAGFRTLTANVAFEMPEAAKGSTHYLTLFFAALVLFAITFVLNTIAELVRRHFRRRMQAL